MSTPSTCSSECGEGLAGGADPATGGSPFVRVRFNDGMLLDAADLRLEQNSHLWRDRLHQALLHGAGTVWGLGVRRSADGRQLQVEPGLAIDARGRNLYIANTLCLDVTRIGTSAFTSFPEATTEGRRRAWVVLSYEPCAREPASALRPVCAEAPVTPAWSRQVDSVRVDLVGEAPEDPIVTLRRFLERDAAAPDRGPGRWFGGPTRATALRDLLLELAIGPKLPGDRDRRLLADLWGDDTAFPLALAEVELGLDGERPVVPLDPDNRVRALLPSTQMMAELLFGVHLAGAVRGAPSSVVVEGLTVAGGAIAVQVSAPVDPASVTADSVLLHVWEVGGWVAVPATLSLVALTLTITPTTSPGPGQAVQILLRGTGAHALVGLGGLPFAGETGPSPLPVARDLALVAAWS